MKLKIILFSPLLLFICSFIGDTKYISPTYGYSLAIPDGWSKKDKSIALNIDLKLIDGKGNSFIITVQKSPDSYKGEPVSEIFGNISDRDFENIIGATNVTPKVVKRGTTYYANTEFYYIHLTSKGENEPMLYHKVFFAIHNRRTYSFNATCFYDMQTQTAPYFERIFQSLQL